MAVGRQNANTSNLNEQENGRQQKSPLTPQHTGVRAPMSADSAAWQTSLEAVRDLALCCSGMPTGHAFYPFPADRLRGIYGAVRDAKGDVRVTIAPGNGTTFEILLP